MGIVDPHRSCGEGYTSISVALFGSIGHFIRFKVGNLHDGNLFTHTHKSDLSLEEPCSLAPKGSGMVADGRRRTSETDGRTIATRGVDIIKQAKDNQDTRPLFTPGSIKPCAFYQNATRLDLCHAIPPKKPPWPLYYFHLLRTFIIQHTMALIFYEKGRLSNVKFLRDVPKMSKQAKRRSSLLC